MKQRYLIVVEKAEDGLPIPKPLGIRDRLHS